MIWLDKDEPHERSIAAYCLEADARRIEEATRFYRHHKGVMESHRYEPEWKETISKWDELSKICWEIAEK